MTPGVFQLLSKTAATLAPSKENQELLDNHFVETDTGKWNTFKQKLRSKDFVAAVKQDDRADTKLKRFAQALHQHYTGKGPSFNVPSQSKSQTYMVKYHPSRDGFSCSCGDWTYVRSVKGGKKQRECKHIQMLKYELQAQGKSLTKQAAVRGSAAAVLLQQLRK